MLLPEEKAARLLVVRAVEESAPALFSDDVLVAAHHAAAVKQVGAEWLTRRADYLYAKLPTGFQAMTQLGHAPSLWILPLCIIAFLIGLATNLLGPAEKLHVIRNPVFVLVGWNLCVYIALLLVVAIRLTDNRLSVRSSSARRGATTTGRDVH